MTIEIEDAVLDDPQDEEQEQKPQRQAVDVQALAKALADEVGRGAGANETQRQRERRLQKETEAMLAEGIPEAGIRQVLRLVNALMADREDDYRELSAQEQREQHNQSLWAAAEAAAEELTSKLAGGKRLTPGLVKDMDALVKKDPAFSELKEKIARGGRPTKSEWGKLAEKAFDDYAEEAGVNQRQPINLKSSKPKPSANSAFDESQLDRDTRQLYFGLKNRLGEEKAQKYVSELLRERG